MVAIGLGANPVSDIIMIFAMLLLAYVVFRIGKLLMGIVLNIVLGFISIFAINYLFNASISFNVIVVAITALLGLPGVALIILLRLFGINL
jgi:hypothetical protein